MNRLADVVASLRPTPRRGMMTGAHAGRHSFRHARLPLSLSAEQTMSMPAQRVPALVSSPNAVAAATLRGGT